MRQKFACHTVSPGVVEGEALISSDPILFYKTDSRTGIVTETGHCLAGKSVKDKILIFPGGKGSSVVQADGMYKLNRDGVAPKGFIVRNLDTILVSSAIIMEMPMVDQVDEGFYGRITNGDFVCIDTRQGIVEILDWNAGGQ